MLVCVVLVVLVLSKVGVPRAVICGSRRLLLTRGKVLILRQLKKGRFTFQLVVAEG